MLSPNRKKKFNPMLLNVIIISALVHIVALVILGGITVVKYMIPDEAEFEEPPAIEEVEPPLEVEVKVQPPVDQQLPMQNLRMQNVGDISIQDVAVDIPSMSDSFTISSGLGNASGLGAGIGSGGGLGMKMPELNFFGARSKGEKICFVVHFGPATTNHGDKSTPYSRMTAYVIRKRLEELVVSLPPQALFNVTAFWAGHCSPFSDQLLVANSGNKQLLKDWMAPVNPVEGSTQVYGSSFGSFGGRLAQTPWPQKVTDGLPSYGPAWYYNYVTPTSVEQKYFGANAPEDATIHWARGLFWALTTQQPDTIYILTTNYLPDGANHPEQIAKAYREVVADLYDLKGDKAPTVNVVVLTRAGANPKGAQRVLEERFGPIIRASKGDGSVIDDISKFMTNEERRRLKEYAKNQ